MAAYGVRDFFFKRFLFDKQSKPNRFYKMQFGRETLTSSLRWFQGRIPVVTWLIVLNIGAFLIQFLVEKRYPDLAVDYVALSRDGIAQGRYWQFVTYMFLHGGWLHLFVNCLALYLPGREVEAICGPKHFLGIYFLGGIFGGIVQMLASSASTPLVGASAGASAALLAFTTIYPELELTPLLFLIIPVRMKAKWLGRLIILISIVCAATGFQSDIGHLAHLGGALTGIFYARRLGYGETLWFQRMLRERRRLREHQERLGPSEFISEEIDPILDKISREGIHSLTRTERRILELGRDKIAKKTAPRVL